MAEKGWTARVAVAAGAAAGTGAAQLGLGYGLGVVVWPAAETPDDSVWLGSLGWATWIAASATVFGAVIASRLGGGPARRTRGPWRLALATSAAAGALVAVALIALPARSAVRTDTFSPQVIAGGYAVVGLAIGLVVAYWAVVSRPVAANLITTAVWLWALAVSEVVVELTLHRTSATYLTSWQFAEPGADHRYGTIFWPSAALTLAAAFLIGILAVIPAARRGHLGVGAATSGAVGPLLVAAAFFVLAPRLTGALGPLESAYLIAPYAVISGLAGSALTVALAQAAVNRRIRKAERRAAREADPALTTATGVATVPAADVPAADVSTAAVSTAKALAAPERAQAAGETSPTQSAPSPSPKGRARLPTRSKAAPTAPAGGSPAGDQGVAAGSPISGGPPAVPKPSATGTASQQGNPGSTRPAPAEPNDPVRPWDLSPGATPGRSTPPAATAAAKPASGPATPPASTTAQPSADQPRPGKTDQPRPGTADQPRLGTTDQARPRTTDQPRPRTADQPRPGTTDQPRPRTTDQPRPRTADQPRPGTTDQPRTAAAEPTSDRLRAGTAQTGDNPSQADATSPSSQSRTGPPQPRPSVTGQSQAAGTAQAARPGNSQTAADTARAPQPGSGSARPASAGGRAGATGSSAGGDPDDGDFDPEIAAAARPRGRAKKAAPPRKSPTNGIDKAPKSTVTPPPTTPTIAQINPKPPKAD